MFDSVPSDAVGYVASAYLFFLLMVLVYIAILGAKFQRINRELGDLIDELESEDAGSAAGSAPAASDADKTDTETAREGSGRPEPAGSPPREESSV